MMAVDRPSLEFFFDHDHIVALPYQAPFHFCMQHKLQEFPFVASQSI